jgi:hypothetical protein
MAGMPALAAALGVKIVSIALFDRCAFGSGISDGPLDRAEERCELWAPSHCHRISRLMVGLEPGDRGGNCVEFLRIEVIDGINQERSKLFKVVH